MRVACIGASVAGLGTALEILKLDKSVDVTLFDKKAHVGANTLCGGAISTFMLRELKMELPSHVIASEITGVRMYAPNGSFWDLQSHGQPYAYVLWREKFEMDLARKVVDMGGTVALNHEITRLDLTAFAEGWVKENADVVVGADGLLGVTRKFIGLPIRDDDTHLAVQTAAHMSHPNDRIDLYFGREVAPRGYAWIFPEGNRNQVRIGLGVPLNLKLNPKRLLDSFMEKVNAEPMSDVKGKLIPTAKPPKKLVYGNIVLVGDAAHLTDPVTGGGIAQALLSGKYAAKAIVQGKPEAYDSYCRGLKRRNLMRYRLKRILCDLSDEDFNEMVGGMKGFNPKLTRISWAIMQAILALGLKRPKLYTRHRVLRRLLGAQ